jgi:hypothetical protein
MKDFLLGLMLMAICLGGDYLRQKPATESVAKVVVIEDATPAPLPMPPTPAGFGTMEMRTPRLVYD